MAGNSTISITFKLDGDAKSFKELSVSAEGFKGVMTATIKESEHLKKSLVNWSQGVQAINAITETISNVSSAFSALTDKMKGIQQENLLTSQLTGKTGEEMTKLRNAVKATADHFGEDFGDTMRAVNSLAKGFGITAEEALQLVRDGFVSGANANGEFVDTLKEYPRYFKEAGLSAEQFIAITTNAAKQGIYSDKGVDVIKEGNLRIREMTKATADAMNAIGISAEKVQEDLANGSLTTFDVMQMVSAKLAELPASSVAVGTAIADIFGGPGEDAGLEYIKTLATVQTNMDAVKASAGEMALQQEKQIQTQENLKNSISGLIDLTAIYTDFQPYIDMTAQVGMAATGVTGLIKTFKQMNIVSALTSVRIAAMTAASNAARIATATWTGIQKVFNIVLTANPIGLVVTAIGALVAAIVYAYNNCEDFRKICDQLWSAIKPLAEAIMKGLTKAFEWLIEKTKEAWEWLKKIIGLSGKKAEVTVEVKKTTKQAPSVDTSGGGNSTSNKYDYKPSNKPTGGGGSTPKVAQSSNGLIGKLEEKIADARKRLNEATSEAAIEAINKEIAGYESQLTKYRELGKEIGEEVESGVSESTPKKAFNEYATSLKDIESNISILREQLQEASIEEAAGINRSIAAWQAKADAIREAGKEVEKTGASFSTFTQGWGAIKGISGSITSMTDALKGNGNAWQTTVAIVDGFIGLYNSINTIVGIINLLSSASLGNAAAKGVEATAEASTAATRTAAAATNAAAATTTIISNKLLAASYKELAAAEYMAAHAYIPFAGFGIAMGFTSSMLAAVTAAGIPMLAEGGIASGPTLAMVGEYAGASGNPEVIAPLNKLRAMLEPRDSGVGQVEFKIEGRTLVGILQKENNIRHRS